MSTRDAILQAARAHYLEGGLAGLSMRRIAAEVGISAPAIYRHYDDKLSLVFALVAEGYHQFSAHLRESVDEEHDALPQLIALSDAYVDFALTEPATYQLLFLSTHHLAGGSGASSEQVFSLPPELQALGRDALWILVTAVERAMEAGALAPDDALAVARVLWAQLHGGVALHLAQRLGTSDEGCRQLCRRGFVAAVQGLGVRG